MWRVWILHVLTGFIKIWWRFEILNQNPTGDLTVVMSSWNVNHRSTVNWLAWSNWIIVDFDYFCLFCSARRYFHWMNPVKGPSWFMVHESWITEIYSADGNPMFDIYGNPPNHPVLMRLPAPTQVRNELSKVICVSKWCEKLLSNLPTRTSGSFWDAYPFAIYD